METKKKLWGCGHPASKKKRPSKKDSCSLNQSSSDDQVNLATSLIKFVKKRFTVSRKRNRPVQEKKHPAKTKTAAAAVAVYKKHLGTNLVTLEDWMSTDMGTGRSGEFHVFKQVISYKKIHPSFDHRSNRDGGGKVSRKKSCNMDQMLEKLISDDGGATVVEGGSISRKKDCNMDHILEKSISVDGGVVAVVEGGSSPQRQSSGDTTKKKVTFRLPLVTKIVLLESPDLKE